LVIQKIGGEILAVIVIPCLVKKNGNNGNVIIDPGYLAGCSLTTVIDMIGYLSTYASMFLADSSPTPSKPLQKSESVR
jgi:hypothetical protein